MAESQVCCCGSNRSWLLFLVALRIIGCIGWILIAILGILTMNKHDELVHAESAELLIGFWIVLVTSAIVLLIHMLPIIAEMKKKPRLLLAFRNWTILIAIIEVILAIAGIGSLLPAVAGVGSAFAELIWDIIFIIFTLVLVQRRMKELQEEIGETSFLKFV